MFGDRHGSKASTTKQSTWIPTSSQPTERLVTTVTLPAYEQDFAGRCRLVLRSHGILRSDKRVA